MDAKTVIRRYLRINRTFGRLCGLWYYQNSRLKYCIRVVIFIFAIISIFVQVAKVIISNSLDALADQCPFLCVALMTVAKMYHYIFKEARFKVILENIFDDWKANRSKAEYDIMNGYGEKAVFIMTIYLTNAAVISITFYQVALVPLVLDIVSPLNVSRGIGYVFPAYYFIDEHRYYYLIVAHMILGVTLVMVYNIACDSTYTYIVQHACGLLAVSGNRFRNAIQATVVRKEKDADNDTYQKVRDSIQAHKRAIKYMDDVENIYAIHLTVIMTLMISSLTVTLLKITTLEPCKEFYQHLGFTLGHLTHLLLISIHGQFVLDAGEDIYDAVWESLWYNGPCRTQALYVLILRRSLVSPQFTVGSMVAMNLRSYIEIVKVSVSYFTVLKST